MTDIRNEDKNQSESFELYLAEKSGNDAWIDAVISLTLDDYLLFKISYLISQFCKSTFHYSFSDLIFLFFPIDMKMLQLLICVLLVTSLALASVNAYPMSAQDITQDEDLESPQEIIDKAVNFAKGKIIKLSKSLSRKSWG